SRALELTSPWRDGKFCRAHTEPGQSASLFPDPRSFPIASSLHLNSFAPRGLDLATKLPPFVCALGSGSPATNAPFLPQGRGRVATCSRSGVFPSTRLNNFRRTTVIAPSRVRSPE